MGNFLHAKLFLVMPFVFSIPFNSYAKPVMVKYVIDGDTIVYQENGGLKKVRLSCIDAPELKQPFGLESKLALKEYIGGKAIDISVSGKDKYGREIAYITYQNQDINLKMVDNGFAWVYNAYCHSVQFYEAQDDSRRNKRGLWAAKEQQEPWVFRREHNGIDK